MRAQTLLLGFLACSACNAAAPSSTGFASGPGGVLPSGSTTGSDSSGNQAEGSSSASVEDSAASGASSGSTTPLLDVGGSPDSGSPQPIGCKGKIDVLFVISRGGNIELLQAHLSEQFPKLLGALMDRFQDFDYHIMAVDGDDEWGLLKCNEDCTPEGCPISDYPCDLLNTITVCDDTIGAGTVFNAGALAYNKPCMIAGGNRYMVNGQPDLEETFTCMATMGYSGGNSLLEAMSHAISPELNGPGGCNEGFLRDDALLLVVFLPDAHDQSSDGDHWDWFKAIREAKNSDLESVVFLYFGWLCEEPNTDRICQLREHFPHWVLEDLNAADYGPAMNKTADLVFEACASFIPQ